MSDEKNEKKLGFIIVDTMGCLFAVEETILHKLAVDLPKKHDEGGVSALRFARRRLEKRHKYIRDIADWARLLFLTNDKPNISGLVISSTPEFIHKMRAPDLLIPSLQQIVRDVVEIPYGGKEGLIKTIKLI